MPIRTLITHLSTYWVIVHVSTVFWADMWRRTASTCDSDRCFTVSCLVSGCLAKVSSAEAAGRDAIVVSAKLSNRMLVRFRLSIPAPCFLVGDPGPDYPSVRPTPNSKGQIGGLNSRLSDTRGSSSPSRIQQILVDHLL